MIKTRVELAISAAWIIPVIPAARTLENCTLLIDQGMIVDIVTQNEFHRDYLADTHHDLPKHALIPGLINAHGHAAMSLLRGYADDHKLQTWLESYIWPAESRWVDEHFVKDGTELAMAEMLLSGTTCFSDQYFFPEVSANCVHHAGMRAQIAFPILDFATAWGSGPDHYLEKGLTLHDNYRSHARIHCAFGPHAPYTVSDAIFSKITTYANELDMPIHIHLHETQKEVADAIDTAGIRPIQRLDDLGVLSPLTQCVHMSCINDHDIVLLQSSGAKVIHCPTSNMKLASGICPTYKLEQAGITTALGTDSAASNNSLSLFSEMKLATLLAKVQSQDAATLQAHKVLEMATLNAAKTLGLEQEIGSLEKGKAGDVCAIDLSNLTQQPVYNPISQLVYTDCSQHVRHVWVAGRQLVKDRVLLTLNEEHIKERTLRWQEELQHDAS